MTGSDTMFIAGFVAPTRRAALIVAVLLSTSLLAAVTSTGSARAVSPATAGEEPSFTFVSAPDLFNTDVGDLRAKGIRVTRGRNSWNSHYSTAVDKVFSTLASYDADAYLVAGDTVEGHWGQDVDRTGYFGPVRTFAQRMRAVTKAGNFYYGEYRKYLGQAGIDARTMYPAVGDHEIGDNPWRPGSRKHRAVATYKAVWARNFTTAFGKGHRFPDRPIGTPFEDTSYATWLTPSGKDGVLLVTVDVFRSGKNGVTATVSEQHLAWFARVLAGAPREATVIVQGHTPAIGPVRASGSSALFLDRQADKPFWKLINTSGKVDFFFAGEVHATTARRAGDTVQVTHGGLFSYNGTNYLVGRVYGDRVELDSYNFPVLYDRSTQLWATSTKRPPATITYGEAALSGTLTLHDDGTVEASGDLELNPVLPGARRCGPADAARPGARSACT